jgi:carbonic anhydrase
MLYQQIDIELSEKEKWSLRRQLGIPNNRRLFVLTCMDERVPIEKALGIEEGDAHIFRNAGGLVTDDVIRSAMLTTQFFGTKEIIIINHTECGMMTTSGDHIVEELKAKGIDLENVRINPLLPELKLQNQAANFSKWIEMFSEVDETCQQQIEALKNCPLIPKDTEIHGYVWQVESMSLRRPYAKLSEKVNTAKQMAFKE